LSAAVFVLDNSVVMAWGLREERTEDAHRVIRMLDQSQARVPAIWPLEFANAMLTAERRRRLTEANAAWLRESILSLPISVVTETPAHVITSVVALAREQGLSVYDASYLDLAMREGLPLATLDDRLRDAARRCSVPLLVEEPVRPKTPRKAKQG
jgi:predicted nucleic acid-binding protein